MKRAVLCTLLTLLYMSPLFGAQQPEEKRILNHIAHHGVYGNNGKTWSATKGMHVQLKESKSLAKNIRGTKATFAKLLKSGFYINGRHYEITEGKAGNYVIGVHKNEIVAASVSKKAVVIVLGAKGSTAKQVKAAAEKKAGDLVRIGK